MPTKEPGKPQRIVSCIPLFNEIDILRLRIEYEYEFVDSFVVVEGTKTFSGKPKPLYFQKYKHLFNDYLEKIEYHVVVDLPNVIQFEYIGHDGRITNEYRWHLEEYTRNTIKRALAKLDLHDSDLVLISDIDEFVDKNVLLPAASKMESGELHHFYLHDYRCSIDRPPVNTFWIGPYMAKYLHIRKTNLHTLRTYRHLSFSTYLKQHFKAYIRNQTRAVKSFGYKLFEDNSKGYSIPTQYEASKILSSSIASTIREMGTLDLLGISPKSAGIQKIVRHYDAGWHLSDMTGGLEEIKHIKFSSFSHSEYSPNVSVDLSSDCYVELHNFVSMNRDMGLYDFEAIDEGIPDFIKKTVASYCILLQPTSKLKNIRNI